MNTRLTGEKAHRREGSQADGRKGRRLKGEQAQRRKANFSNHLQPPPTTSNYFKPPQTISNNITTKKLTGSQPFVQAQFIASQKRRQPFKHRNSVSHQTPQAFKRAKPIQTASAIKF